MNINSTYGMIGDTKVYALQETDSYAEKLNKTIELLDRLSDPLMLVSPISKNLFIKIVNILEKVEFPELLDGNKK